MPCSGSHIWPESCQRVIVRVSPRRQPDNFTPEMSQADTLSSNNAHAGNASSDSVDEVPCPASDTVSSAGTRGILTASDSVDAFHGHRLGKSIRRSRVLPAEQIERLFRDRRHVQTVFRVELHFVQFAGDVQFRHGKRGGLLFLSCGFPCGFLQVMLEIFIDGGKGHHFPEPFPLLISAMSFSRLNNP
nr:MAG TPA: hypothetical protein [Caudoviricetes sp.]